MFPLKPAQRAVIEMLRPDVGGADALWRRAPIDWTEALGYANAHYLGPALYSSVARAGCTADLPTEVRDYLTMLHATNGRRNQRLTEQAHELAAALNEAGIRPMLLKGALSLVDGCAGDPAARMLRDLDFLVPADCERAAVHTLERLGYSALTRYPRGHHAYGDFARRGDPGAVDLHFELTDLPYVLRAREVRRRARPVAWRGATVFVPRATDAVLHNVLHAQVHYRADYYLAVIELRQLYDFVQLAQSRDDAVDWSHITERLAAHRLQVPLESYALAAHRLFGMRWPLQHPASLRARAHHRRCLVQQRLPAQAQLAAPWANLRRAFARHRMDGLYANGRPLAVRWLQHTRGVLQKGGLRLAVDRLLRTR